MSEYEEQRQQRIAENIARMESLGLFEIASSFKNSTQGTKNNKKPKKKDQEDERVCTPEGGELDSSNDNEHVEDEVTDKVSSSSYKRKRGRGHTLNAKLDKEKARRAAKGKNLDIQFPPPYFKLCGKHAKFFKSEATVCIRQKAPLQVNSWRDILPNEVDTMWKHMKEKLNLSEEVKDHAMNQVQSQYKNRHHYLHNTYLANKDKPNDVSMEDWNWLIKNKWSDPKFQEWSLKNKANRSKQGIKSIIGTKSIVQTAFEMKEASENDDWPDAVTLWKATHMRSNGTWCIPNGEQIMENLKTVGEFYQEEISNAQVPLAEHFKYGLGAKRNHLTGIGSAPITKKINKQVIQAQVENAQKRANDLEMEVQKLNDIIKRQEETNIQLHNELESHRGLIDAQKAAFDTQEDKMKQLLEKEVKNQLAAALLSFNGLSSNSSASTSKDPNP